MYVFLNSYVFVLEAFSKKKNVQKGQMIQNVQKVWNFQEKVQTFIFYCFFKKVKTSKMFENFRKSRIVPKVPFFPKICQNVQNIQNFQKKIKTSKMFDFFIKNIVRIEIDYIFNNYLLLQLVVSSSGRRVADGRRLLGLVINSSS